MARQYYKDSTTGQMKPLGVKVEDTLPVGTEVDYDGQDIPEGWIEIDNPNEYSTTEKVVGKWIDGKPLYRKTFEISSTTISSSSTTVISFNLASTFEVVDIKGVVLFASTGTMLPIVGGYKRSNNGYQIRVLNNALQLVIDTDMNVEGSVSGNLSIEYTKTTD